MELRCKCQKLYGYNSNTIVLTHAPAHLGCFCFLYYNGLLLLVHLLKDWNACKAEEYVCSGICNRPAKPQRKENFYKLTKQMLCIIFFPILAPRD